MEMLTFVESSSNFVCSAMKRTQKQLRCISVGHFECEKAGLFIIGLLMPPDTLSISGIFDRSSDSDCGIGIEPWIWQLPNGPDRLKLHADDASCFRLIGGDTTTIATKRHSGIVNGMSGKIHYQRGGANCGIKKRWTLWLEMWSELDWSADATYFRSSTVRLSLYCSNCMDNWSERDIYVNGAKTKIVRERRRNRNWNSKEEKERKNGKKTKTARKRENSARKV